MSLVVNSMNDDSYTDDESNSPSDDGDNEIYYIFTVTAMHIPNNREREQLDCDQFECVVAGTRDQFKRDRRKGYIDSLQCAGSQLPIGWVPCALYHEDCPIRQRRSHSWILYFGFI